MYPSVLAYSKQLENSFHLITPERKERLIQLAQYIKQKHHDHLPIQLMYVCTHNSRRSHFGQVWAAVAAAYYGVSNVFTFSGGTEATAFNPNAIKALRAVGFVVEKQEESSNPEYKVSFGEHLNTTCFSKVYNHTSNPSVGFAAIMTCSDAEQNCPFIPGAELRIAITYRDPKEFDGTEKEEAAYLERSEQIARECLFVFSQIAK